MENKSTMSKLLNKYKPKTPGALISKFISKKQKVSSETGFYETLVINKKPLDKQQDKSNKDNEICKKIGNVNVLTKTKYMIPSQFPNITRSRETKDK